MQQVNAAGIPVITVNAAIDGVELASTVAIDNIRSAERAATYVAERLQGRGAVVNLRGPQAEHRSKGGRRSLAGGAQTVSRIFRHADRLRGWR